MRWWPWQQAEGAGDGAGAGGGEAAAPPVGAAETTPPAASGDSTDMPVLHWAQALPAEMQNNPRVKQARTLNDYVKRAIDTEAYIGRSVQLPEGFDAAKGPQDGQDLTPVFRKLGMPEKATEYTIDYGAAPEGMAFHVNETEQQQFREEAFAMGLAQWQVDRLAKWEARRQIAQTQQAAAARAEAAYQGKVDLGERHGANMMQVIQGADHVYEMMANGALSGADLGPKLAELMESTGLVNNPDWITGLANLELQMREAQFRTSHRTSPGVSSPADARARVIALTAKEAAGTITPQEVSEMDTLYDQLARQQAS